MHSRWKALIPVAACALLALGITSAATAATSTPATGKPTLPSLHGTTGPDIHRPGKPAAASAGIPVFESGNWSGYVAVPKSGTTTTFKYIYAQYTVPSVNCSTTGSDDAFAYHWIGLDGWSDSTVEQDGVADFCVDGTPEYDAWWEMYPLGFSTDFAVNAGDAIASNITYNSSTDKYALYLKDETSGQSFSVSEACPSGSTCDNSSAEDITEGYASGDWTGTADFGQEFYNSVQAENSAGVTGALNDASWSTDESVAYGSTSDEPTTEPGQLYNGSTSSRSAFEITWERVN